MNALLRITAVFPMPHCNASASFCDGIIHPRVRRGLPLGWRAVRSRSVRENRGVSAPAQRDAYRLGGTVCERLDDSVLELGIVANLGI